MIELVPLPFCIISIADCCELIDCDFIVKAVVDTGEEPAIPSVPAKVALLLWSISNELAASV